MHDVDCVASVGISVCPIWLAVLRAIENERCLDLHYRATRPDLRDDKGVPNYKVMKQLALRNRLKFMYPVFIGLAPVFAPILALFQWMQAILLCSIQGRTDDRNVLHIIPTTPVNIDLIRLVVCNEPALNGRHIDQDCLFLTRLSRELGLRTVLHCVGSHIRLIHLILKMDRFTRRDLLLHARDAFVLIMLTRYARDRPNHVFATDDHYQRWGFLLSWSCTDFRIVQHGFLDSNIRFPHSFGNLHTVYVRDPSFVPIFARYYKILESKIFSPIGKMTTNPFTGTGLFLASSFPSIDQEIALVELLKAHWDLPVIVKFHPAHTYDDRRGQLAALASHVCSDEDRPACLIFVSYNSFMEFDYKAAGIPTFSIASFSGVAETAEAIFALLSEMQRNGERSSYLQLAAFP